MVSELQAAKPQVRSPFTRHALPSDLALALCSALRIAAQLVAASCATCRFPASSGLDLYTLSSSQVGNHHHEEDIQNLET